MLPTITLRKMWSNKVHVYSNINFVCNRIGLAKDLHKIRYLENSICDSKISGLRRQKLKYNAVFSYTVYIYGQCTFVQCKST